MPISHIVCIFRTAGCHSSQRVQTSKSLSSNGFVANTPSDDLLSWARKDDLKGPCFGRAPIDEAD